MIYQLELQNVPRGPSLVGSTENESRSLRILDGRIGPDRIPDVPNTG